MTIAPQTSEQIESVGGAYRLYAAIYPIVRLFTQLDRLLFFTRGYVVLVEGRAPAGRTAALGERNVRAPAQGDRA